MKAYTEIHRGAVNVKMPGLGPLVISALDARNIGPQLSKWLTVGPHWMLIYLHTPARFKLDLPGARWVATAPDTAVLFAPGARYYMDTRPARGPSWHTWLVADGLDATSMVTILPAPPSFIQFQDPHGTLAMQLGGMIDAIEENKASPFWAMQMHGRVVMDVMACAAHEKSGRFEILKPSQICKPDPIVGRAVTYMEAHISERIRLADLAKHLHVGPSTLSHRFLAFTGESPMHTLRRMRLIRTKVMIVQGHKLAHIASALGFYDEHHLSLAFKQSEALSPRAFLKQNRKMPLA